MKRRYIGPKSYEDALERRKANLRPKRVSIGLKRPERAGLKRSGPLRKGKKVKAWDADRRALKVEHERMGIVTCELRGNKEVPHVCSYDNFLSFAHDAKRRKLKREDLKRAILICLNAHDVIEFWPAEEMKRIVNDTIAARKEAA